MRLLAWIAMLWTWILLGFWAVAGWADANSHDVQWLAWIPSTAWLVVAIPGLITVEAVVSSISPRPRWLFFSALIPVLVLTAASIRYDWRPPFTLPENSEEHLRIAFINASHPPARSEAVAAKKLLELDTDVTLITDAAGLYGSLKKELQGVQNPPRLASTFRVSVLSNLPILKLAAELATKDITGVVVEIKLSDGQPLRILVVDLASSLAKSRVQLAGALQRYLNKPETKGFDLIVGDFNMTPRSHGLGVAVDNARNVFENSGSGWGGTWPSSQPILRLDHGFVSSDMKVLDARTFNIGVAHRGLLITLEKPTVRPKKEIAGAF